MTTQTVRISVVHLFGKRCEFVRPRLDVGQSVGNVLGILSHAYGCLLDALQAVVSQLLELDVQGRQVGAALQLRC